MEWNIWVCFVHFDQWIYTFYIMITYTYNWNSSIVGYHIWNALIIIPKCSPFTKTAFFNITIIDKPGYFLRIYIPYYSRTNNIVKIFESPIPNYYESFNLFPAFVCYSQWSCQCLSPIYELGYHHGMLKFNGNLNCILEWREPLFSINTHSLTWICF